jgi:conserved oligomeric Golgi complex subunit 6
MSSQSGSRTEAVSSRLTSVLSASFTDLEIRDALGILESSGIRNTPDTRRRLRIDVQQNMIDYNGDIVKDFGAVAEVDEMIQSTQDYLLT